MYLKFECLLSNAAFKVCGVYSVIPKFDLTEQQTCPPFNIKVLSPLEAMNTCLMSSSSADGNYCGLLAAFVAYLIKMEEKGERVENVDFIDDVFYNTIKKMEIPRSNLATFLAGTPRKFIFIIIDNIVYRWLLFW